MQRVLIIDNYDSFTYNLVQAIKQCGVSSLDIVKNDKVSLDTIRNYTHIILSPGPGLPSESGHLMEFLEWADYDTKIFGVCLGLQAIGERFGCQLKNFETVFHGRKMPMKQTEHRSVIFKDIDDVFYAGRYHSWAIEPTSVTKDILVTAVDDEGEIMAIEHRLRPIYAVQFHPESFMTPEGNLMIKNFLEI